MKLIGKQKLFDFQQAHADARSYIQNWIADVEGAKWATPHDLKAEYTKVSLPGNRNAVFDVCGDKYRLWVRVDYVNGIVHVKEVGTHKQYDKWSIK